MKKCIIGFIVIMIMIYPKLNVKAYYTGYDFREYDTVYKNNSNKSCNNYEDVTEGLNNIANKFDSLKESYAIFLKYVMSSEYSEPCIDNIYIQRNLAEDFSLQFDYDRSGSKRYITFGHSKGFAAEGRKISKEIGITNSHLNYFANNYNEDSDFTSSDDLYYFSSWNAYLGSVTNSGDVTLPKDNDVSAWLVYYKGSKDIKYTRIHSNAFYPKFEGVQLEVNDSAPQKVEYMEDDKLKVNLMPVYLKDKKIAYDIHITVKELDYEKYVYSYKSEKDGISKTIACFDEVTKSCTIRVEKNDTYYISIKDINTLNSISNVTLEIDDILGEGGFYYFDEIIHTNSTSQVEFTFNFPLAEYTCVKDVYENGVLKKEEYPCPLLELEYDIYNSYLDGGVDLLSIGIPYIQKTFSEDTGTSSVARKENITLSDNNKNRYTGNYTVDYDNKIDSLKLIVPIEYIMHGYVRINIKSSEPFSVNKVNRDNEGIGRIDITGKAGIGFIAKSISNDKMVGFNFGNQSTYGIQVRDSYEIKGYKVLSYYSIGSCHTGDFSNVDTNICVDGSPAYSAYFNLKRGNLKQIVLVKNRNYPSNEEAIVLYDKRYFDYVVYDFDYSRPILKHPITGEEITFPPLTEFDDYYIKGENDNLISVFYESMKDFKENIIKIFRYISELFNSMPQVLKNFFIVIFVLSLFVLFVKFIL